MHVCDVFVYMCLCVQCVYICVCVMCVCDECVFVCRSKREMERKREKVYVFNVHMCASQEPSMHLSLKRNSLPR